MQAKACGLPDLLNNEMHDTSKVTFRLGFG